ncbi:hypothetical protein OKA04_05665 [Luteolibacter flavescens]|uniref:Uncharacterized protein n=1 Tax=Luteolibacter flavescens TaxID=1859460 RepID=A0ABT3FLZ6_9BACT|nr:hypothetical protein [Luteolibacter flavescens]MCW1884209.1 hypothetical protein [Luteolibacter flavescens]
MKLSRTSIIGLALALAGLVLTIFALTRPSTDGEGTAGAGEGGSGANFSSTTAQEPLPRKVPRSQIAETKPLAVKELELLWARGKGPELLIELDRVSATQDLDYWREIGPLFVKKAQQEGRPDVANYLLATGDASPDDNLRIEIYAAGMDNRDEGIQTTSRLELENITGEEFRTGAEARAWLQANPRPLPEVDEMSEDQ